MSGNLDLSVVIPVRDEAAAIPGLADEIDQALGDAGLRYEVVWVDDGSVDASADRLRSLPAPHRLIRLDGNHGQSVALVVGFRAAAAEWIATLDGDGQNDPADLPRQLALVRAHGADCCNGVRINRTDAWPRRLAGRVGNRVRAWITGDRGVTDVGCSTRVLAARHARDLPPFHGMHRFLPTLVRMQGGRVIETPVNHRPRRHGVSKYGVIDRMTRGLRDCLGVRWLRSRWRVWQVVEGSSAVRRPTRPRPVRPDQATTTEVEDLPDRIEPVVVFSSVRG